MNSGGGASVGIAAVNRLVDLPERSAGRARHSDRGWRQVASCNTALGQSESHRDDPTPDAKGACPVRINWRLNLSGITRYNYLNFECTNIHATVRDTAIT